MRSSTAPQAAAILARSSSMSVDVTIAGVLNPFGAVNSVVVDAQMKNTLDQISTLGGAASRQATFKIPNSYAAALSPYQASIAPAALALPIGASVVISVSYWPGAPRIGTATWTSNIFTGYVVTVDPIDVSADITVTCQDLSFNLGSNVSLPAAGILPIPNVDFNALDLYYSSLVVVDLVLRGCGIYLTLPPVLAASLRPTFCLLSIPAYGGNVPDIGQVVNAFAASSISGTPSSRTVGHFAPDVVGSAYSTYEMTAPMSGVTDHNIFRIEGWVKVSGTSAAVIFAGGVGGGSHPNVGVNSSGQVYAGLRGQTTFTASNATILDGAWHYIYVLTHTLLGSLTIKIYVDGSGYNSTPEALAPTPFLGTIGDGATFVVGSPSGTALIWFELLEVIYVSTGTFMTTLPSRYGNTPSFASSVTATSARLQAIAPQTGLNAWNTIQSLAEAEGALCWFDEDGTFFFEPQVTWLARRTGASQRTLGKDSITNVQISYRADGLRKTVSANYSTVTAIASTAAAPAFMATTEPSFGPGYTVTTFQTTSPFFNPSTPAIGASNVVGNSWFYPVAASSVGDPSAALVTGVQIVIVPTATGFNLGVNNPYRYPIAFWNPTPGTIPQGPAMVIHGTRIVTGAPITVSYTGNTQATDDLALPDNPWRQDLATTQRLVYVNAMDTYNQIPVIQNIDIPGDPRLQLGDVDTLVAPAIPTPGGIGVVLVNIQHNITPTTDYRMTLGIKPLGPPTGWLAGVPGRSEAGTTTYASIP